MEALVRELNAEMRNPSREEYVYRESLGDYIYRRFFKAGIVIVRSLGALWGALNLWQIARGGTFLELQWTWASWRVDRTHYFMLLDGQDYGE